MGKHDECDSWGSLICEKSRLNPKFQYEWQTERYALSAGEISLNKLLRELTTTTEKYNNR